MAKAYITWNELYELINKAYSFYRIDEKADDGLFDRKKMDFGVEIDREPKTEAEKNTRIDFELVENYFKSINDTFGKVYTPQKLCANEICVDLGRKKVKAEERSKEEAYSSVTLAAQTKTKTEKQLEEYSKYVSQFAKTKKEKEIAAYISEKSTFLFTTINELRTSNKILDENDVSMIKGGMLDVMDYIKPILNEADTNSAFNKTLKTISDGLYKDLNKINSIQPNSNITLAEAMVKSQDSKVKLDDTEMTKVGGNASERIPMKIKGENGKEVLGFFTKSTTLDIMGDIHSFFNNWGKKDAQMKDICDRILKTIDGLADINGDFLSDIYVTEKLNENDEKVFDKFDGFGPLKDMFNELNAREDFPQLAEEFKFIDSLGIKYEKYIEDLNLPTGVNIDKRNSAMSFVAEQMGCPKLVARSKPIAVTKNGVKMTGTFMEFAEGSDANNLEPEDPYYSTTPESFNHCSGFKDVANIGVLDYICSNIDRHRGNMFYKYSEGNPKELIGVVGIDNDLSFGTPSDKLLKDSGMISDLSDMKYIGKDAAEYILKINENNFKVGLRSYGLLSEEVEAAVNRLNKVKDAITSGQIKPLADEEWKKLELKDLVEEQDGPFRSIQAISDGEYRKLAMRDLEKKLSEPPKEKKVLPTGSKNVKVENFKKLSEKLGQAYDDLLKNNKGLLTGSKQYDNVLAYTKYARDVFGEMAGVNISSPKEKMEYYEKAQNVLANLNMISHAYLDYKQLTNSAGKNERSMNRTLSVATIEHITQDNLDKYRLPNDQAYKQYNAELRKEMYKQLKPKELGNMIKQLDNLKKDINNGEAVKILDEKINSYFSIYKEKLAVKETPSKGMQVQIPQ